MAHLPQDQINLRREVASNIIIHRLNTMKGYEWYAIQCPCEIDGTHMPRNEVPRIVLPTCLYPGKLDFFYSQPFHHSHGFRVR